jgi:hypothetical protein
VRNDFREGEGVTSKEISCTNPNDDENIVCGCHSHLTMWYDNDPMKAFLFFVGALIREDGKTNLSGLTRRMSK